MHLGFSGQVCHASQVAGGQTRERWADRPEKGESTAGDLTSSLIPGRHPRFEVRPSFLLPLLLRLLLIPLFSFLLLRNTLAWFPLMNPNIEETDRWWIQLRFPNAHGNIQFSLYLPQLSTLIMFVCVLCVGGFQPHWLMNKPVGWLHFVFVWLLLFKGGSHSRLAMCVWQEAAHRSCVQVTRRRPPPHWDHSLPRLTYNLASPCLRPHLPPQVLQAPSTLHPDSTSTSGQLRTLISSCQCCHTQAELDTVIRCARFSLNDPKNPHNFILNCQNGNVIINSFRVEEPKSINVVHSPLSP